MLCHAGVQVVLHLCLRIHLLQLMRHDLMGLRVLLGLHVLTGLHLSQIGGQSIISKALSLPSHCIVHESNPVLEKKQSQQHTSGCCWTC